MEPHWGTGLAEEGARLLTCAGTPSSVRGSAALEQRRGFAYGPAGAFPPRGLVRRDPWKQGLLLEPELPRDGQLFLAPSGLPSQIPNEAQKPAAPTIREKASKQTQTAP